MSPFFKYERKLGLRNECLALALATFDWQSQDVNTGPSGPVGASCQDGLQRLLPAGIHTLVWSFLPESWLACVTNTVEVTVYDCQA